MNQPKVKKKIRRRGNDVPINPTQDSNTETQTSYSSAYSTLLAPIEAIGQLPLIDLSTTLNNIKTATTELVLHPLNFKAILMASINRSIGFKKTLTTGQDASGSTRLVSGEEGQPQSNRSSLYQNYLHNDSSNLNFEAEEDHLTQSQSSTNGLFELGNSDIDIEVSEYGSQVDDLQKAKNKLTKLNLKREKTQYKLVHLQVELDKILAKKIQLETKLLEIDNSIEFCLKESEAVEFKKVDQSIEELSEVDAEEKNQPFTQSTEKIKKECEPTDFNKSTLNSSKSEIEVEISQIGVKDNEKTYTSLSSDKEFASEAPATKTIHTDELDKIVELDTASTTTSVTSSPYQDWQAHETCVTSIFQDPTGSLLVTSAMDGTIRLWSEPEPPLANQIYSSLPQYRHFTLQASLNIHQGAVHSVKILDGILVSAGQDTTVRVWNCRHLLDETDATVDEDHDVDPLFGKGSRSPLLSPSPTRTPYSNQSPSIGSRRFSNTNSSASLAVPPSVDIPTKASDLIPAFTLKGHRSYVRCLDMDEKSIISGSNDGTMRQWDLESGRMLNTFDPTWTSHHPNLALGRDKSLEVLQTKGPQYEALSSTVGALQFFKHGLASGTSDGIVRMWDLRTGQPHRQLTGHTSPITDLKFDFYRLVSASLDRSVKVWDLRAGKVLEQLRFDDLVTSVQFDTHKILAASNQAAVSMYDRTTFHTKLITPSLHTIWSLYLNEGRMFTGDVTGALRLHTF